MTPDEIRLKRFIDGNTWTFAKTYAKTAPHEYVVYDNLSDEMQKEYEWFVKELKEKGVDEKFFQTTFRYLYFEGKKYWTHDTDSVKGGVLNRDEATNKYESGLEKPKFDRDGDGAILPTLRNSELVNALFKKCKSVEKFQAIMGADYAKYFVSCMFDPRKQNVFFRSPENARKAKEKADLINRLDREWLAKRKQ